MYKKYILTTLLLIIGGLFFTLSGQENFALNFKGLKKFEVEYNTQSRTSQSIMNQKIETEINNTTVYDVQVKKANKSGGGELKFTIIRKAAEESFPLEGRQKYDTDKPKAEKERSSSEKAANLLKGKSFMATLGANGSVVSIEGEEELIKIVESVSFEGMTGEAKKALLLSSVSEAGLKTQLTQIFNIFPPPGSKVGSKWQNVKKETGKQPITINQTITYSSLKDNTATFTIKADIAPNPDAETIEMNGQKGTIEMNGVLYGSYVIDTQTGLLRSFNQTQNTSGTTKLTGGQLGAMEIPIKTETITKIIVR